MKLGPLIQKLAIARFARTFASLYHAGVPVQEALEIVADTSGNVIVGEAVLRARAPALTLAVPLFPARVASLQLLWLSHLSCSRRGRAGQNQLTMGWAKMQP